MHIDPDGLLTGQPLWASTSHRPVGMGMLQVLGRVERGDAALTDLLLDAVAAGEDRYQAGGDVGHLAYRMRGSCR
jgi:hypothetical protein